MKRLIVIAALLMGSASAQAYWTDESYVASVEYNEKCGTSFTEDDIVEINDLDDDYHHADVQVVFPAEGYVVVSIQKHRRTEESRVEFYTYEAIEVFCSVDI